MRIGHQICEPAIDTRHVGVQVGRLTLGEPVLGIGPGDDGRRRRAEHDLSEAIVLGRLRRLVEQHIDADGADPGRIQPLDEIGDEASVDGRAVGQAGEGVLGDGDDDDVRMLRLGGRQQTDAKIIQPALGRSDQRDVPRQQNTDDDGASKHCRQRQQILRLPSS